MHISWMLLANFYNALTMCSNLGHVLVLYPYSSYRRLTHTQANSSWRQKGSAKSDLKTQSCSTSTQYVKMGGFFSLIPVLFWKTTTLIHHVWMDHVWSVCNLVSSFWLFSNSHDLLKQSMMSEHGLRMEPCENSECLWESTLRKQVESCDLSFFKTQNCSWNMFPCSFRCSGQEWFYFRLLPAATPQMFLCLYGKHIIAMCSLSL